MESLIKVKDLTGKSKIDVYDNLIYIDDENGEHKFDIAQIEGWRISREGSFIFNILSKYFPFFDSWIDGWFGIGFIINSPNERKKVQKFGLLVKYSDAVKLKEIISGRYFKITLKNRAAEN